jgi:hypothetical protein
MPRSCALTAESSSAIRIASQYDEAESLSRRSQINAGHAAYWDAHGCRLLPDSRNPHGMSKLVPGDHGRSRHSPSPFGPLRRVGFTLKEIESVGLKGGDRYG